MHTGISPEGGGAKLHALIKIYIFQNVEAVNEKSVVYEKANVAIISNFRRNLPRFQLPVALMGN